MNEQTNACDVALVCKILLKNFWNLSCQTQGGLSASAAYPLVSTVICWRGRAVSSKTMTRRSLISPLLCKDVYSLFSLLLACLALAPALAPACFALVIASHFFFCRLNNREAVDSLLFLSYLWSSSLNFHWNGCQFLIIAGICCSLLILLMNLYTL